MTDSYPKHNKQTNKKPTINIIFHSERVNTFPKETKQKYPLSISIQNLLMFLARAIKH